MNSPNGWEPYAILFYAALLAFGIPIALRLASRWLQRGLRPQIKRIDEWEDSAWANRSRILNKSDHLEQVSSYRPRFLVQAYPAILLIAVFLIALPLVSAPSRAVSLGLGFLFLFLLVGLVHAIRKGDLDWQRSFRTDSNSEPGGSEAIGEKK